MSLTKKHFKAIAKILNNLYNNTTPSIVYKNCIKDVIKDLCDYFKIENPLFDEQKFKDACLK